MPDQDGYPTQDELQSILDFEGAPTDFMSMINLMWWHDGFTVKKGRDGLHGKAVMRCYLSTWGWSGNEEIIPVLKQTWFWLLWWRESRRGGHYTFEIPMSMYTEKFSQVMGLPHSAVEHRLDLTALLKSLPRATLHHKSVDGVSSYTARVSVGGALKTSPNTVIKVEADTPEDALEQLSNKLKGKI